MLSAAEAYESSEREMKAREAWHPDLHLQLQAAREGDGGTGLGNTDRDGERTSDGSRLAVTRNSPTASQ